MILYISNLIIPLLIIFIIFYAYKHKVNIYNSFIEGAKEGLHTMFNIFPNLLAMIFAINIFLKSNLIEFIFSKISFIKFPLEIIPMALLRPLSGTGSFAILNNIFSLYGPDSFIGRLASTIQGSTETTIYVLALYFGSIKIFKTRYALKVGLIADLVGILTSILVVYLIFT